MKILKITLLVLLSVPAALLTEGRGLSAPTPAGAVYTVRQEPTRAQKREARRLQKEEKRRQKAIAKAKKGNNDALEAPVKHPQRKRAI